MSETSLHAGLAAKHIDSMCGARAFAKPSAVVDCTTVFTKRVWPGGRRPSD